MTICYFRDTFTTSVYNPNPRTQTFYVRLPVIDNLQYSIKDLSDPDTPGWLLEYMKFYYYMYNLESKG